METNTKYLRNYIDILEKSALNIKIVSRSSEAYILGFEKAIKILKNILNESEGNRRYMNIEDKMVTCVDCNRDFVFTVGQQNYFKSKNLIEPKRCPACVQRKREAFKEIRDNYTTPVVINVKPIKL